MLPNIEQTKSLIRWFLSYVGGVVTGYLTAKNMLTPEQLANVAHFFSSETTVALLVSAGTAVWGVFVHTRQNAVAVVGAIAALPDSPVKGVVTEPTVAGRELAASIEGPQVVAAGTPAAAAIAAK